MPFKNQIQIPPEIWCMILSYVKTYETLSNVERTSKKLNQILKNPSSNLWQCALTFFFQMNKWYTKEPLLRRANELSHRLVLYMLLNKYCFSCDRPDTSAIYWKFRKRYCSECATRKFVSMRLVSVAFGCMNNYPMLDTERIKPYPYKEDYYFDLNAAI